MFTDCTVFTSNKKKNVKPLWSMMYDSISPKKAVMLKFQGLYIVPLRLSSGMIAIIINTLSDVCQCMPSSVRYI